MTTEKSKENLAACFQRLTLCLINAALAACDHNFRQAANHAKDAIEICEVIESYAL